MATTVADIALEAFTEVASEITDAVVDVTVTRVTQGAYNATTGAYTETETPSTGKAILVTERPIKDIFPTYKIGPKDQLWLIRGIASILEADELVFSGDATVYKASATQDILKAGALHYVVVQ